VNEYAQLMKLNNSQTAIPLRGDRKLAEVKINFAIQSNKVLLINGVANGLKRIREMDENSLSKMCKFI
jgi:hypothetical protein